MLIVKIAFYEFERRKSNFRELIKQVSVYDFREIISLLIEHQKLGVTEKLESYVI